MKYVKYFLFFLAVIGFASSGIRQIPIIWENNPLDAMLIGYSLFVTTIYMIAYAIAGILR